MRVHCSGKYVTYNLIMCVTLLLHIYDSMIVRSNSCCLHVCIHQPHPHKSRNESFILLKKKNEIDELHAMLSKILMKCKLRV